MGFGGKGGGRGKGAGPPPQHQGGTKVYVGNLAWETSWQDLKDHFKSAGEVVHADVMMEGSGRSKGCGLVTMASARDASKAISMLHDSELGGRPIFVREDRENAGGGRPGSGAAAGSAAGSVKVHVGNLPFETSWQELKDLFKPAAQDGMVRADIAQSAGRSKGFGTVTFASSRDAARAIQMFNDTHQLGRVLQVQPSA